jgi:hypothetical protein
MKELLDHLRGKVRTLTVYDYEGSEERLETLRAHLSGYGVAVRTAVTDRGEPPNVCVFHRGDDLLGAVDLDRLLPADSIERAFAGEGAFDPDVLPFDTDADVTVSPGTEHGQMVDISRQFERRALEHGDGWLRAGFQTLSALAESERTRSVYRRLAAAGVDVTAIGYPDADLNGEPFEVVDDADGQLRDYWFLLYDGGTADAKAALVAEHLGPSEYEAFRTVDPETVDDLVALAREEYPLLD